MNIKRWYSDNANKSFKERRKTIADNVQDNNVHPEIENTRTLSKRHIDKNLHTQAFIF